MCYRIRIRTYAYFHSIVIVLCKYAILLFLLEINQNDVTHS